MASPTLSKATTPTIRRKLINIPARISTSARRITLLSHYSKPIVLTAQIMDQQSDAGRAAITDPHVGGANRCSTAAGSDFTVRSGSA
ncbi:hypothetical protein RCH23_001217 [Cryobacterium sp. CAN_C3]|nr:hypothetical protein [Cryobacterium sp. CAN_C3]